MSSQFYRTNAQSTNFTVVDIINIYELLQQSQSVLEYYVQPTFPQILSVVFTNQLQQVQIVSLNEPAYLLDFAIRCRGSYGCKKIVIKLLEGTATRVKVTIENVYYAGFFRHNPGGVFPFVTIYDDFIKEYQAQIAPPQKVGLVNPTISLDIPPASEAGVNVGETALIEVVYLFQILHRQVRYY